MAEMADVSNNLSSPSNARVTISCDDGSVSRDDGPVEWPAGAAEAFWNLLRDVMDYRASRCLEMKFRKSTGTEHLLNVVASGDGKTGSHAGCCGSASDGGECHSAREVLTSYAMTKCDSDELGREVDTLLSRDCFIPEGLLQVAERASTMFHKIITSPHAPTDASAKSTGVKSTGTEATPSQPAVSKPAVSKAEKAYLQRTCLIYAVEEFVLRETRRAAGVSLQHTHRDGGRVAYPSSFRLMLPDARCQPLDWIPASAIAELMRRDFVYIPSPFSRAGFGGALRDVRNDLEIFDLPKLVREMEWLEMNGVLQDQTDSSADPVRTDQAIWLAHSDLKKIQKDARESGVKNSGRQVVLPASQEAMQPTRVDQLLHVVEAILSLPFELNAKASLGLTVADQTLFSVFPSGSHYKRHIDNSTELNNGRVLSVLLLLQASSISSSKSSSNKSNTINPGDQCGNRHHEANLKKMTTEEAKSTAFSFSVWPIAEGAMSSEDSHIPTATIELGADGCDSAMSDPPCGLLLFKSSKVALEIPQVPLKTYVVRAWCHGPKPL